VRAVRLVPYRARETKERGGSAHPVALRAVAHVTFVHAFAEETVLFPAMYCPRATRSKTRTRKAVANLMEQVSAPDRTQKAHASR
jgi:hypothetical protein